MALAEQEIDRIAERVAERVAALALSTRFRPTTRRIADETVECVECDDAPVLYHRTTLKGAAAIAENGHLRPSKDTGVISYSASPEHTFGGTVKFPFKREDVGPLRPMCYASGEAYRKASNIRDEKAQREGISLDAASAQLAFSPEMYVGECEQMGSQPVPIRKAQALEYWVHQGSEVIEEVNVGCKRRIPHHISATAWAGDPWDRQMKRIAQAREVAGRLGLPFRVRSCFPYALISGWGDRYIPLDDANLARLERGEEPVVIQNKPPEAAEADCRC